MAAGEDQSEKRFVKVFISYSHDSPEHSDKVLALSERLRVDGIETRLDQYVDGSPAEGWPRWMLDQLDASDFVLAVCTETYYRRFRGHEKPGKSKGVDWEGALITQELYDGRRRTLKFVPVFLSAGVERWIPEPLRSLKHYALTSESAYQDLYDFLLEQAGVEPGKLGTPKPKLRRKGTPLIFDEASRSEAACFDISRIVKHAPERLVGREAETKLLNNAWDEVRKGNTNRPHVLTFVALGGEGKTSLVAKWAAELAYQDWPGCDAALAWSFYSQGTRDQAGASSDTFLNEALTFFGDDADKQFAGGSAGAFEKGQRLARLVGQRRNLLILDGLEPLQCASTSPTPGLLKDQGIAALLKGLAANRSHGLCVVTTRYPLPDLRVFSQTTAPEVQLLRLSREAGVALLQKLDVKGSLLRSIPFSDGKEKVNEFEKLVEDVKGHALTLTLLGGFLKRACHGDVRERDRVKFEKADEKMDGGHAFRTMAAYEQWLLSGGNEGQREVAVLRLMGLFDRPADAGCLAALRSEAIPGLTEPLASLADDDWEFCLSGLEAARLLTVNRDPAGAIVSLDAHPLLREYFARQLREQQPDAWRAAHRRLYKHLCATTTDKPQPTLEDLQPLCQAIAHGCYAGQDQDAFSIVYRKRINRGRHHYLVNGLGASNTEFGLLSSFFKINWEPPLDSLDSDSCIHLLRQIGLALRATGRLKEAIAPLALGFKLCERVDDRDQSVNIARHIAQTHLTFGDVQEAKNWASRSVCILDERVGTFDEVAAYAGLAHVLHCQNDLRGAVENFEEARRIHSVHNPDQPFFAGLQCYRYCDLLITLRRYAEAIRLSRTPFERSDGGVFLAAKALASTIRARALMAINFVGFVDEISAVLHDAVQTLRNSGRGELLIPGLLPSAEFLYLNGQPKAAKCGLDEALEIAERGPMRLFLADIHLYRAKLFGPRSAGTKYPWESPQADLNAAEELINTCSYHLRDSELADLKEVAKTW